MSRVDGGRILVMRTIVSPAVIEGLVQAPVNHLFDDIPTNVAVKMMNIGWTPRNDGIDGIVAEVFQQGGDGLLGPSSTIFHTVWTGGKPPQEWIDAIPYLCI